MNYSKTQVLGGYLRWLNAAPEPDDEVSHFPSILAFSLSINFDRWTSDPSSKVTSTGSGDPAELFESIMILHSCSSKSPSLSGVELRPFFTKILAWTTFVHFSNPGAKNPSLDEFLGIYALFCRIFGDLRTFLSNFWGFIHFFVEFLGIYALFCRILSRQTFTHFC